MALPNDIPLAVPAAQAMPMRERVARALAWPAHPAALSTVVAIAAAHLAQLLPGVGWLLDLVVWAAFFKYGFEVLRWSANGREDPPELSLTMGDAIGIHAVLLLVAMVALLAALDAWVSHVAALLAGIAWVFGVPAMLVILALEEGPLRAVNPLTWLMLGSRIGRDYFVLVSVFLLALLAQCVAARELAMLLPAFIAIFISSCVANYLMLANFHLIGGVIHAHGDELGYTGHLQLQEEVPHTNAARQILDAARTRAASGDVDGAVDLLRDELATHADSVLVHEEYRHWLRQESRAADLAAHGRRFVPVLLAQGLDRRAVDVARECQVQDPAFALEEAGDVTRLAHAAAQAGQTQVALGLLAGFHKRFRNHPDIGRNYLLAAKLWAERMNKEMQARALLNQIKLAFPHDPVIADVDAYLAFLDTLAATPARTPPSAAP